MTKKNQNLFKQLKEFLITNMLDFGAIFLLSFSLPLFFYKLGQSSLVSWDEAWFASIAQNIVQTGEFWHLIYNGEIFIDHPPFGFWLMAISFKFLGISEFSARLPSAIAGLFSLYFSYFLGKELFNRSVGFISSIALVSSIWFLFRARSGNLDIILTMLFISSFLLALKAVKNNIYFIPLSFSLAFLFLTKTLVPFTIIPALVIIFANKKIGIKNLLAGFLIFFLITGLWFGYQIKSTQGFIRRYLGIGYPGNSLFTEYFANIKLAKEYLHNGIGKWFWPGMSSVFLSPFLKKKQFVILSAFVVTFLLPFIFSNKGHIWHLIPVHPFLILAFFGFSYTILKLIINSKMAILIIYLIGFYFTFFQLRQSWYQFINIPAYVSDEAILSKEAGKYPYNLYVDGDFNPAAAFYSDRVVYKINVDGLNDLFNTIDSFTLITNKARLDQFNISEDSYKIIKSDRDKILVLKND